jgi:nitronate monooxygenase
VHGSQWIIFDDKYRHTTSAQIAALLTMGAAGVVLGTRFLFTVEAAYPQNKKDALIKADLNATVRTLAYDEVNRTMGWPPLHDGRAIRNRVMDDVEEGLSLDERLRRFDGRKEKGEDDRLVIWAGVGAGLTNEIMPAAVSVGPSILFLCA